ncbi:hypothetical protein METP2_00681 [Methanosarcinales archaeon]|nr:hypothetical protein [Candidatus Methanoperedens sp.]CAG0959149.1 hypothetical protein METP2_00681 [Methanosarcinales archaeon]
MDCCRSSKPNETDKDTKQEQTGTVKNPAEKEQKNSAGCCGGGTKDMLLHIVLMVIVVLAISYFTRG